MKSDYRKQEIKEVEYDYTDVDAPTLSGTARTLEPAAYEVGEAENTVTGVTC